MNNIAELKIIDEMAKCYIVNHLSLSVLECKPDLAEESLREIKLCAGNDQCFNITIFDEYDDAEIQNPVLWLHLVIDTCCAFENPQDYDEWRKDEGYADNDFYKSLYQQYAVVIPEIRKVIGDVITIGYHHMEFNTNIAWTLRECHL